MSGHHPAVMRMAGPEVIQVVGRVALVVVDVSGDEVGMVIVNHLSMDLHTLGHFDFGKLSSHFNYSNFKPASGREEK